MTTLEEAKAKLWPCPFCGGEARIAAAEECGANAYVVSCDSCMASSAVRTAIKEPVFDQLVEHWNQRSAPGTSCGTLDVLVERHRQKARKGFDAEHDSQYRNSELAKAAGCYLLYADAYPNAGQPPPLWPWEPQFWKPEDWRRDLVRAAALTIAEIDRLDRRHGTGGAS